MMRGCVFSFCVSMAVHVGCVVSQNAHSTENVVSISAHQDTLVAILDRLTSLDQRFNSFDQRLNAVDDRVNDLKHKVDTLLTQSTSRTNTVLQDLRAVCTELSDVTYNVTSPPVTDAMPPSTTQQAEVPFRITRVRNRETADFYRVYVMYEASTKPTVFLKSQYNGVYMLMEDQGKLGMVEVDIPKTSDRDPELSLQVPGNKFTVQLNLDSKLHSMDIPHVDFEMLQGKNIKFRPGQEVSFDFMFDVEGDVNNIEEEDVNTEILMQSDTHDNVFERYHSYIDPTPAKVDLKEFGGSKGHRYGKAILNSTKAGAEGILDWYYSVNFDCYKNCFVRKLGGRFQLKFYHEDHKGPFPENFLGFIRDDFRAYSSQFACGIDSDHCYIRCEVIGHHLTSVEITRIGFANEDLPVNDVRYISGDWGVSQLVIQNVSFGDAGDFLCTARSQTKEVTQQLTLNVVKVPRIIMELSNMTFFENNSLLLTCVAEGIPAPNVTFVDPFHKADIETGPAGDSLFSHVTHPGLSQTKATLFVRDVDVFFSPGQYRQIFCSASNVPKEIFVFRKFDTIHYLSIVY